MAECSHIHLIKQTGPMDGGLKSIRYRCEECSEFLYATPEETSVEYGPPSKQ